VPLKKKALKNAPKKRQKKTLCASFESQLRHFPVVNQSKPAGVIKELLPPDPVQEVVIEYQRKIPFKGFASDHLFPNEAHFNRKDSKGGLIKISGKPQ